MKYSGRDILLGGLFTTLALALPIFFHLVGLGSSFLPMFFPLVAAGFILPPIIAVSVGTLAPILSALLTGMPPLHPPIALLMIVEGFVLTALPALLYQKLGIKKWLTLTMTLLLDRILAFLGLIIIAQWLNLPPSVWGISKVIQGLPGIVLLFIVIPPLITLIENRLKMFTVLE